MRGRIRIGRDRLLKHLDERCIRSSRPVIRHASHDPFSRKGRREERHRDGVESDCATAPTGGVMSVHPLPTLRTQAVPSAETDVAVQVPAGDTKITTSAPESASPMPAGFSLKLLARSLGDILARRALCGDGRRGERTQCDHAHDHCPASSQSMGKIACHRLHSVARRGARSLGERPPSGAQALRQTAVLAIDRSSGQSTSATQWMSCFTG